MNFSFFLCFVFLMSCSPGKVIRIGNSENIQIKKQQQNDFSKKALYEYNIKTYQTNEIFGNSQEVKVKELPQTKTKITVDLKFNSKSYTRFKLLELSYSRQCKDLSSLKFFILNSEDKPISELTSYLKEIIVTPYHDYKIRIELHDQCETLEFNVTPWLGNNEQEAALVRKCNRISSNGQKALFLHPRYHYPPTIYTDNNKKIISRNTICGQNITTLTQEFHENASRGDFSPLNYNLAIGYVDKAKNSYSFEYVSNERTKIGHYKCYDNKVLTQEWKLTDCEIKIMDLNKLRDQF